MPTEVVLEREGNVSWDFQLTGGASFEMPLTIFDVKEGGLAEKAGLRLGDHISKINDQETDSLTLEQAHQLIDESGKIMSLSVTHLEDQEDVQQEAAFEKLRVDIGDLDLKPPQPAPTPEKAARKSWHPIMLDTSPPPIIEVTTGDEEAPHKKLMRNLRDAMDRKKVKDVSPEVRKNKKRCPPPMSPPARPKDDEEDQELTEEEVNMAQQLRDMKRQLEALSALPAVLQQSLSIVSQNLNKMLPPQLRQKDKEATPDPVESEYTDEEHYDDNESYEYTQDESTNDVISEDRDDTYSEVERSYDDYMERDEDVIQEEDESVNEQVEEEQEESEMEPEPEPTPEEIMKLEKIRKLKELNRAWPWGDEIKPVYKISQRYQVPHSKLFTSRIQSLENKVTLKKPEEILD